MAKQVTTVEYVCDSCGRAYRTAEEADRCSTKDKLNRAIWSIDENPAFQHAEGEDDEDIKTDSVEYYVEPENATTIDEVASVTISEAIHGLRNTVYIRKGGKNNGN